MKAAIKEALKAKNKKEVPIGAVIVLNDKIIARAHNLREKEQLVISHAEINAIKKASKKLGTWRLEDCDLYVTLEPCPMCAGAIIQSRMRHVYFGAYDPKGGALVSKLNLFSIRFNHQVAFTGGILEDECKFMLQSFFQELRGKALAN